MRFNGHWFQCDDGVSRPVIRGEIQTASGDWEFLELLIDTGADRTVLTADVLGVLGLPPTKAAGQIGGLGGIVQSVTVSTQMRLTRDDGVKAAFRSEYVACSDRDALDMSVLGRDILDMFALVVDRQQNVLALLAGQHRYSIEQG
jgi:predicted aspartyl protease